MGARSYLLSFHQNASKTTLKALKESIFPPKPKKPETAFLLFLKQVRPKYLGENPHMKSAEVVKKASQDWAKLNPFEKETFQKEYVKKYELYTEELREYNNSISDEQKQQWEEKKQVHIEKSKHEKVKRKREVFGKPKKPPSAFVYYLQFKKSERDADKPFPEWIKATTSAWNELSEAEKEPFFAQATQRMTEYKKDLDEWEMKMMNSGHPDIVRHKTLMKYKQAKTG